MWQNKLATIKKTNHTFWQTFKITGPVKTRILIFHSPASYTLHYTVNLKKIHNSASLEHEIKRLATLPPPINESNLNCTSFNRAPRPDKIAITALKKLSIKPIIQIYYIFKVLNFSIFPRHGNRQGNPNPQAGETSRRKLENNQPPKLENNQPTISKLFEKIIITHLLTHVNNSNIIISQQFGFRKKSYKHPAATASYGTHHPRDKQKQNNTTYSPTFKISLRFNLA